MDYIALFGRFVAEVFSWRMMPLHILAIFVTVVLVTTGMDWTYLVFVHTAISPLVLLTADVLGFFLPSALILAAFLMLVLSRKKLYRVYAKVSLYAVVLGLTLSTTIKAFTGRTSPPHFHHDKMQPFVDNSNAFHFGFMNEQVLGGWPSSHATIAFALAVAFSIVFSPCVYIRVVLFGAALFIGVGVTFGFHWLSEFVAGVCLGTAVGLVVGEYYKQ